MSKVPEHRSSICSKIPPPRTRTSEVLPLRIERNVASKERPPQLPQSSKEERDNKTVQSNHQVDEDNRSKQPSEDKSKYFNYRRGFGLMIPKINIDNIGEKLVQNPRILDLRNKLNEINKKRERDVDKETKTLINDITQQLKDDDEAEASDSGPYSLLLDLHPNEGTTSKCDKALIVSHTWKKSPEAADYSQKEDREKVLATTLESEGSSLSHAVDRKPNIISFEGKNMNEFEYSCGFLDNNREICAIPPLRVSSRSDLCLHFTNTTTKPYNMEFPSPTTDNSLHRPTEENSLDDSLGILTPDQMDDMFSPTVEGLPVFCDNCEDQNNSPDNGDTPSTDKTETNSAVSTMFMENEAQANGRIAEPISNAGHNSRKIPLLEEDEQRISFVSNLTSNVAQIPSADITMMSIDESALEFGEADSTEFFTEKHNDIMKDTNHVPNIEDELMPSVHSSILEPVSSLVDTTINLDLPLDSKHFEHLKSHASQRIEQTPSPEDLPLDPSELHCDTATYSVSQESRSTLHDSQTFSEAKTDFVKSMETSKVSSSFITSITSITSLDGYQGDGEMSRPVSRGADQSIGNKEDVIEMNWQNVPVNRRPDPMTDSDFFTESDADGHDDLMHRGDRRAQVIDGALYGGKNNNVNAPLIVNRNDDSCMDSSGVYTDLETHRCSPVFLNAIDDITPDGSSPSTRSECSQKNGSGGDRDPFHEAFNDKMGTAKSRLSLAGNDDTSTNTEKSRTVSLKTTKSDSRSNEKLQKEEKRFALKKYKMPKRDVPSKLKTMLSRRPDSDASIENSPSNKTSKKHERREIIPKKLNLSDNKTKSFKDIKSKVDCCFSLQRSQTACSVSRMLSSKSTTASKPKSRHMRTRLSELGSVVASGKSSLHSSQSDISCSASSTPPAKHAGRFPLTRSSKKRETGAAGGGTASPRAPLSPPAPAPPPTHGKKNGVVAGTLPKLPSSPVAARSRAAPAPTPAAPPPGSPRKPAQRRQPTRPNTLPAQTKEPVRSGPTGAGARAGAVGKRAPAHVTPPSAPSVLPTLPSLPTPPAEETASTQALAHAAKGVEALGVLVQYLVCQLEALNGDGWRAEAARWRGLAAAERSNAARASQDHQQRAQKDLDTIGECLSKISELEVEVAFKEEQNARLLAASGDAETQYRSTLQEIAELAADIKELKNTIAGLKRDVAESRGRLCTGADRERSLAVQLDAAKRDLASAQLERHPDLDKDKTELAAEVRSLRAVLELKQAEASELRHARSTLACEVERRACAERELETLRQASEELRERAAARQRDADALRDENRRLRECAVRDQQAHARLTLYNEELRYKLRQKSQVVSLLASAGSGAYLERSFSSPRTRAASCGSGARTPSPGPDSPSPADSPPPEEPDSPTPRHPAVKGVVEKQDSVSWVLEIEESPEEVATRLARRSGSFRTSSSPGAGVKRRNGGSPSSPASPAPASPAPNASKLFRCAGDRAADFQAPSLKESAGEAIYIYDNRQY